MITIDVYTDIGERVKAEAERTRTTATYIASTLIARGLEEIERGDLDLTPENLADEEELDS